MRTLNISSHSATGVLPLRRLAFGRVDFSQRESLSCLHSRGLVYTLAHDHYGKQPTVSPHRIQRVLFLAARPNTSHDTGSINRDCHDTLACRGHPGCSNFIDEYRSCSDSRFYCLITNRKLVIRAPQYSFELEDSRSDTAGVCTWPIIFLGTRGSHRRGSCHLMGVHRWRGRLLGC